MAAAAHKIPLEVAHTLVEIAEVAQFAFQHHRQGHHPDRQDDDGPSAAAELLRTENAALRARLADDLVLLRDLHAAPDLSVNCPPDLYTRLLAAVNNSSFLDRIEKVREQSDASQDTILSSCNTTGVQIGDVPNTVASGKNGSWVFLSCDSSIGNLEENSGIDNESYVIVNEEDIVDGIATFVARCIIEDPKSKLLSPADLQKVVARALGTMKDQRKWRSIWEAGKVIYTLATWGITLVGLYRSRAILKMAAKGAAMSAKFVLKVL